MEEVSAKTFDDLDILAKLGAGQFRAAANGVLQQASDRLGDILGYPSSEALQAAASLPHLFMQASDYRSWLDSLLEEAHRRFATRWVQKNGRIISIDLYGHANFSESGELLFIDGLVFPSKLYETKNLDSNKAISRLMKQNREFMALYEVGQALASTLDINEIYRIMYEKIASDLLDAAHLTIALYDEDTEMITCGYVIADGEVLDPAQFPPLPLGEGPVSDTIRSREARIVDLRSLLPNLEEKGRAVTIGDERHAQSSLFVPLMSGDQLLGVMHVLHYEPDAFREADLTLLSILANQASLAMTNARLFAQIQEQTEALAAHVAELEKAESALRASERRYRTIVESAPEAIVVLEVEDGRFQIVEANRSAGELIGVTINVLLESELHQYFPEYQTNGRSSRPFFMEKVQQALAGRPSVFEWELRRKEGSIVPCEISLSRFSTTNHKLIRGMVRDISERKRTEEMLRQVQKIDSLGMLAGGVAHDFNNLLVAMMGQASLALARLSPDAQVRPAVEKVLMAAERASELTQQLLAYSGGGRFEFGALNLNQLVQDNLHLFEVVVPRNVTLRAHFGENVPLIRGDKSQLQQVVMNLIINATEAMDNQEGEVMVRTAVTHIGPDDDWAWQYTGELLPPNTYVMLEVADNGSGIPNSVLQKIFDPFFTTKFTGRGLGLAAVLGIVKTHQGGLAIQTEIGEGTTFQLLFPATDQVKQEEAPLAAPAPAETFEGCVLVIDDEEPVREAVQDILELENIVTLTAANGKEGLALYRQHHEAVKLVLLDLSMPGMSGEETLTGLHEIDPDVKVVLSSGYSQGDAFKQMPRDRLAGFLQKPYRTEQLIDVVQEHLRA